MRARPAHPLPRPGPGVTHPPLALFPEGTPHPGRLPGCGQGLERLMGSWHQTQAWSCLGLWAGGRGARCSLRSCVHSTRDNHCLGRVHCAWALGSPAGQYRRSSGGVCQPSSAAGTPGRPGPSVQGCPPAVRGFHAWAPVPGVCHPSLAALGRSSYCVSALTPSTRGSPEAHGCIPTQHRLGWPRKPRRQHGCSWALPVSAVPTLLLGHVPPLLGGHTGECFPHLSPRPWAADSVPLPSHGPRQSSCGLWGSGPIRPESS